MNKKVRQKGQFIIEMLLAMALMLVILPSLSYVFIASREGKPAQEIRSMYLVVVIDITKFL